MNNFLAGSETKVNKMSIQKGIMGAGKVSRNVNES